MIFVASDTADLNKKLALYGGRLSILPASYEYPVIVFATPGLSVYQPAELTSGINLLKDINEVKTGMARKYWNPDKESKLHSGKRNGTEKGIALGKADMLEIECFNGLISSSFFVGLFETYTVIKFKGNLITLQELKRAHKRVGPGKSIIIEDVS